MSQRWYKSVMATVREIGRFMSESWLSLPLRWMAAIKAGKPPIYSVLNNCSREVN